MVNCNDAIQISGIDINDRAEATGKQVRKPVSWHAAITGVLISAAEYLARAQARSRDRNALRNLDDHMLKDVGLTRSDIERAHPKPFMFDFPRRG